MRVLAMLTPRGEFSVLKYNLEIRNQQLGKRSNLLTGRYPLELPPARLSSIIGFLSHAYRQEFNFRTANAEVGALAHTLFGESPPKWLNTEQENTLLAAAKKKFANSEGPKIEAALGYDVFADDILPEYFMMFARPAPTSDMLTKKRDVPDYVPLISPNRSVLANDAPYVIDLLEEMGISTAADRPQIKIDSTMGFVMGVHQTLSRLGKAVADREMAPERKEKNKAFLAQCVAFGLLDQTAANEFLANEAVLQQAGRFPFFNAFKRDISRIHLGFRASHEKGIPEFMNGFRKLDPAFEDAELSYEFTPNAEKPFSRYQDGDDLTLTFSFGGKTWSETYRVARTDEPDTAPFFRPSLEFLQFINDCLSAAEHPKTLFTIPNLSKNEEAQNLKNRGKFTLVMLTDEEADALISWSSHDRINGPRKYLKMNSAH